MTIAVLSFIHNVLVDKTEKNTASDRKTISTT